MLDKYIGKKVRILEHYNEIVDDFINITQVLATKDSIGVLLSFEEYRAHLNKFHKSDINEHSLSTPVLRNLREDPYVRHLAWIKSAMDGGTYCPIRFEEVVPLPEKEYAKLKEEYMSVDIMCQVGAVIILPTYIFRFVERMV